MALYNLIEDGEHVMLIAGVDKDQFEAEAREAGHPTEVLCPVHALQLVAEVEQVLVTQS